MNIGWIGTGRMGSRLAGHVIDGGHDLTVHDLSRDAAAGLLRRGAKWASSPAEAALGNDVLFLSLLMPEQVEQVTLGEKGVIEGAPNGSLVVDTSTNSLETVLRIREAMATRGIRFMDSPLSGGARGAETRDLCVMASGDLRDYEEVRPVLDLFGDKVMYCGPIGSGTICKLCHQLFGAGMSQLLQEILSVGVKAGVDLMTLAEAISKSAAGKHPPLSGWRNGPPRDNFDDTGPYAVSLKLMHKDISLACELGRRFTVPMTLGSVVEGRFRQGMNLGWADLESRVLIRLQEEAAGVKLTAQSSG